MSTAGSRATSARPQQGAREPQTTLPHSGEPGSLASEHYLSSERHTQSETQHATRWNKAPGPAATIGTLNHYEIRARLRLQPLHMVGSSPFSLPSPYLVLSLTDPYRSTEQYVIGLQIHLHESTIPTR